MAKEKEEKKNCQKQFEMYAKETREEATDQAGCETSHAHASSNGVIVDPIKGKERIEKPTA